MRQLLRGLIVTAVVISAGSFIGSCVCVGQAWTLHSFDIRYAAAGHTLDSLSEAEFVNAALLVVESQSRASFFVGLSSYLLIVSCIAAVGAKLAHLQFNRLPEPNQPEPPEDAEEDFATDSYEYEQEYVRRRRELLGKGPSAR
ncbi:MAG: hypothetical protein H8E66_26040 [Planctomycetes bacterium]|nr:hypothetical protein [Planctomycetota bacterium]